MYLIISLNFFQLNYNFNINFVFLLINFIFILFFYFDKKNIHFFLISSLINILIFSFFYLVETNNVYFIFLIIALVSINDVMGYLIGRRIGKTKIFPKISPNKSLEGTFAGIIFTIFVSIYYAHFFNFDYFSYFLLGLLISLIFIMISSMAQFSWRYSLIPSSFKLLFELSLITYFIKYKSYVFFKKI